MLADVRKILDKDFDEIKTSSLSLLLLKVYSKLYLAGAQPRTCESAMLNYYKRLKKDGLIMAQKNEEKTHKLKKNIKGLKYVGKPFCKHFDLENLTDKEAISLLKLGVMKENQFDILPIKEEKGSIPKAEVKAKQNEISENKTKIR